MVADSLEVAERVQVLCGALAVTAAQLSSRQLHQICAELILVAVQLALQFKYPLHLLSVVGTPHVDRTFHTLQCFVRHRRDHLSTLLDRQRRMVQKTRFQSVHVCLLFRPLPEHLDEVQACEELAFQKDVDGVTRASSFGVYASQSLGFSPCTAEACVCLLDHYDVALDGARVTVVGRSLVIGRPVAMLLQARDATVTLCHSHTVDLAGACREADVIVVATGRPNTLRPEHVRPGQVVVDVGINWDEENQRLVGDVDFEGVAPIVRAITPVPRGVGSVTTAVLAEHVVRAAERSVR